MASAFPYAIPAFRVVKKSTFMGVSSNKRRAQRVHCSKSCVHGACGHVAWTCPRQLPMLLWVYRDCGVVTQLLRIRCLLFAYSMFTFEPKHVNRRFVGLRGDISISSGRLAAAPNVSTHSMFLAKKVAWTRFPCRFAGKVPDRSTFVRKELRNLTMSGR